jgi:hypothetical protein
MGGDFDPSGRDRLPFVWSAPLDDVFIHFDFARSAARGFPFEWIDGNGYSSGGTSLLYPLVLALGLRLGFHGLNLMHFAAVLAATSVFALLLGLRHAFRSLPSALSYLLPCAMLSVGALNWSLFSGMEVAFFLAIWGLGFYFAEQVRAVAETSTASLGAAWVGLGMGSFLIAATRPEAVTTIAVLTVFAAQAVFRHRGRNAALATLLIGAAPGATVVLLQAYVNLRLTGDASAAGAIVKLEMNNPLLTREQVVDAYWFHLKYQILRVTQYHFGNNPVTGWTVWILAAVSLFPRATRRYGILLFASLSGWMLTVALNGQVRWQNERYTMPAVAWLLASAALGLAWLLSAAWNTQRKFWEKALVCGVAVTLATVFVVGERSSFRDQRWFFGRAARNIFDQHVQTGLLLRARIKPEAHRVLVGDAGAIPYISDLPGLDIIGLGGTFGLPFARASQWGVGASMELIQHLPHSERPDLMAIYPGWWNSLPLWFTSDIKARIPVRGNVICGGHTKIVYASDLSSLDDAERPFGIREDERVVDVLDFADLVSEKRHDYRLSSRAAGFVEMKKLPHPENPERDLFDAGRIAFPGLEQTFRLSGFKRGRPKRFILRVVPTGDAKVEVFTKDQRLGVMALTPADAWTEVTLTLPADIQGELPIRLSIREGGPTLFFLWAVESR